MRMRQPSEKRRKVIREEKPQGAQGNLEPERLVKGRKGVVVLRQSDGRERFSQTTFPEPAIGVDFSKSGSRLKNHCGKPIDRLQLAVANRQKLLRNRGLVRRRVERRKSGLHLDQP